MGVFSKVRISQLFLDLLEDIDSDLWDDRDLPKLTVRELRHMGVFLGQSRGYSCRKEELITRLLGIRMIWLNLRKLGPPITAERLAENFTAKVMKGMMRELRFPRSRKKAELAFQLAFWWAGASMNLPTGFPDPWIMPPAWRKHYTSTHGGRSRGGSHSQFSRSRLLKRSHSPASVSSEMPA